MARRHLFPISLIALLFVLPAFGQTYTITDLGTVGGSYSQANAIGSLGQIVGISETEEGRYHTFLYSGGALRDLGAFGGTDSSGMAINKRSQIAGYYVDRGYRAFLWTDGQVVDLGSLGGKQFSVAYALNDNGEVVGFSRTKAKQEHAFLYTGGEMRDLGTLGGSGSTAHAINNRSQITGYAYNERGDFLAFLWQDGKMTSLGTLGGDWSVGNGINEAGQVVGQSYLPENTAAHAFLYDGGRMVDLGSIGGEYSSALALNSTATEIVGYASIPSKSGFIVYRAFLWKEGKMTDLNRLLPAGSGWTLETANGIDDTGQIVGYGTYRGEDHAFLLTPQR